MFVNVALVAVLGAIGASAANPHAIKRALSLRQLSPSDIPSACQSGCQGALTIYDACMNGDTNTCLGICQPTQFSDYRSCLSCILDNYPQATDDDVQAVNDALDTLEQLCDSVGSTVSAADFSATGSGAAASDGASTIGGGGVSAVSSAVASVTSTAQSGASAVSSSADGGPSSASQAVSGAVNSASSAAATTSGAAAYAAQFPNMAGFAVAVVGVVAGAAVVF